MRRFPLFLIAPITLFLLSGCNRPVELFTLEVDPGVLGETATAVNSTGGTATLREDPPRQFEDEGFLATEDGAPVRYELEEPLRVGEAGAEFLFTFTALDTGLELSLMAGDGSVAASRYVEIPGHLAPALREGATFSLVAPAGAEIASFVVEARPADAGEPAGRLVSVAVSLPGLGADAVVRESADGLAIGPGAQVMEWGREGEAATSWRVRRVTGVNPGAAERTQPTPVEITYDYEPPSPDPRTNWVEVPVLINPEGPPVIYTVPRAPEVAVEADGEIYSLRARPGEHTVYLYPEVIGADPEIEELAVVSTVPGFRVTALRLPGPGLAATPSEQQPPEGAATPGEQQPPEQQPPEGAATPGAAGGPQPLPADLGTIYSYPRSLWRGGTYEIFRWSLYSNVLVMDVIDYATQSAFFKRIAFFVEKEDFAGTIMSRADLATLHGYNAHNYNGTDLAGFYNAAEAAGTELNPEELLLRDILVEQGIISTVRNRFYPGTGGILSISQESWDIAGLRTLLLTHEAYHGVYYGEPAYVADIEALWASLGEEEQRFWTLFLDGMQYNALDSYLVVNEFQAYLLQQSLIDVEWYFERRAAGRLRGWKPHEASWIDSFLARYPDTFIAQGEAVNEALFARTGLAGGEVFCLLYPVAVQPQP